MEYLLRFRALVFKNRSKPGVGFELLRTSLPRPAGHSLHLGSQLGWSSMNRRWGLNAADLVKNMVITSHFLLGVLDAVIDFYRRDELGTTSKLLSSPVQKATPRFAAITPRKLRSWPRQAILLTLKTPHQKHQIVKLVNRFRSHRF